MRPIIMYNHPRDAPRGLRGDLALAAGVRDENVWRAAKGRHRARARMTRVLFFCPSLSFGYPARRTINI